MCIGASIDLAQKRGVPLVACTTQDNDATANTIVEKILANGSPRPQVVWDITRGFTSHTGSPSGAKLLKHFELEGKCRNPLEMLATAERDFPDHCLVMAYNMQFAFENKAVIQALQNLRGPFKATNRCLAMLGDDFSDMPESLRMHVMGGEQFSDSRATPEHLEKLVDTLYEGMTMSYPEAKMPTDAHRSEVVAAARGLPVFQAEQAFAMSFTQDTLAMSPSVVQRHRNAMINSVPGLEVYMSEEDFSCIGGCSGVKGDFAKREGGPAKPDLYFWLDEIEKSGLANTGDTSGVNKDQLGTALKLIEDYGWQGVVFLGMPGVAKSQFAKCLHGQFGTQVLAGDLSACKHELVGRSERNIRRLFNTAHSVGGEKVTVILTANSIDALDDALKSRFPTIYYFELPTVSARAQIWDIWKARYGIDETHQDVDDSGFSGRNIKQTCMRAWSMGLTLKEASRVIVPESVSSRESMEKLQAQADGRMISAEHGDVYTLSRDNHETRSLTMEN